jgi:glyoxylase-like metal-dependent hydrolase (beta-lactamase superfamily II)
LLAASSSALGSPRALRAAAAIEAEQSGPYNALEQSRLPAEPIGLVRRVYRWSFDYDRQRVIREAEQHFPGGIRFFTRTALGPEGGWSVDLIGWRTGSDLGTANAQDALRNRVQWERFLPHLLLRQAEAAGDSLELAAPDRLRYRDAAGDTIEITLDPVTRRPASAAQIVNGVAQAELRYRDYVRRHRVMRPGQVQLYLGGRLIEDVALGSTRTGALAESRFAPPAGYAPPPAPGAAGARALAPEVLYFENMPGDYHSMAVDMGDHLVLIEAPLSPDYAAQQRRILEAMRPGKPVRYVLVTHHHGDHNGGLRTWAEAGATIVVPAGARVAIERQLRARGFTGETRIEEVEGRRSFGSGASRLDAYSFASSHAASNLLMHLPGPRILFQGDLVHLPARGDVPPAFPIVRELVQQIEALGLGVDTIAGVHGRLGTREDVRRAIARAQ